MLKVVQCWDDGISADIRLAEMLRKYKAKASFNLNAGLHDNARKYGWEFKGTEVWRLGWDEMREVYEGFTIANHSLTHPHLKDIPVDKARTEIAEGRDRLQQFFQQPVLGLAYPFGPYNEDVMRLARDAGHVYARTTRNADLCFPPDDAMAFHPTCHFLAPDFWERCDAARACGVFYFWGHSYEMITEEMWAEFESRVERISADDQSTWVDLPDLFV